MTEIDLLININLNKIYENESKQEYYNYFIDKDGNSINENHNGEIIAYEMQNNGLIRINGENCHLIKFGEEVCKNGGWLKYLELQKKEEKKENNDKIIKETQEKIIRKETIESFKYDKWGFYLAITSILITVLLELLRKK
ncbi:hypothetical protein [Polaribacter sp.]|uniref:hypothetical protein n=1 Tax=Polaribacter sp. TaxID=1920175 RepID=UPI004048634B